MLTAQQKKSFHENGYLLVPNVLTPDQVHWLRGFLRPLFDRPAQERYPGDTDRLVCNLWVRYPQLCWLLFHQTTIEVMKSLLGERFVAIRETSAHLNQFGGWHKDTGSQELAGHNFHWNDDYLMVEAAYYLQDNSVRYGGGLDVEPGSHREPDHYVKPFPPTMAQKLWKGSRLHRLWSRPRIQRMWHRSGLPGMWNHLVGKSVSIPSKRGDLVIFDLRINHRATPKQEYRLPRDREKLAIFQVFSSNSPYARAYHDFIHTRLDYVYLRDCSYPPELVEKAQAAGITLG